MTKTLTLMALLLGSATANALPAIEAPAFGNATIFGGDDTTAADVDIAGFDMWTAPQDDGLPSVATGRITDMDGVDAAAETRDGTRDYRIGRSPLAPAGGVFSPGRGIRDTRSSVVASVPEPASWGLMVVGFGLVGAVARRRTANVVAA